MAIPAFFTWLRAKNSGLSKYVEYRYLFPLRKQLITWTTGMTLMFYNIPKPRLFIKRWRVPIVSKYYYRVRDLYFSCGVSTMRHAFYAIIYIHPCTYLLQLFYRVSFIIPNVPMKRVPENKDFTQIDTATKGWSSHLNLSLLQCI